MPRLIAIFLTLACVVTTAFSQNVAARDKKAKRLLERIAAGDGVDAEDAADDLLALITGPLDAALDSFDAKTPEQRLRVKRALSKLTARIRARLFLSSLPSDERKQLAHFAELNRPLIDQLFADEPRSRIEAIGRIPIEIGSGAGVAATAGLYDHDENVVAAAFEACREFVGDESVGKGVTRFIDQTMAAHKAGRFPDAEMAMTVVIWVGEAVYVLGELKYAPGVPSAAKAVRLYGNSDFHRVFFIGLANNTNRSNPIDALGKIGDERAAPVLIEMLANQEVTANKSLGIGLLQRTLGDEALINLLRIFKLDPREYGFIITSDERKLAGFVDDKDRQAARNKFKAWYREHVKGRRPASDRSTSKPAGG